jgi:pyruvate kinase
MKVVTKDNNLLQKLEDLKKSILEETKKSESKIQKLKPSNKKSATNFIQYLSARKNDLRAIQDELHALGLSSLASSESQFLDQLHQVIKWLKKEEIEVLKTSNELSKNSNKMFGVPTNKFIPHIMVTYETSFAEDSAIINALLSEGMGIARINCAHDNEKIWYEMINKTKSNSRIGNKNCMIYMDLPGPKIRTIILGKGKKDKKVKLDIGSKCWLVEENEKYRSKEIVIGISSSGIIKQLQKGETVLFDDGLFKAIILETFEDKVELEVVRSSSKKGFLKAEKGINFPDTALKLKSLTPFDEACLPFVIENADMLGYSFVQNSEDVHKLYETLNNLGKPNFPVILKIETKNAVLNLPELILTAMEYGSPAIMIARGDLGIEIGFERLSEIQDEILWLCEAAHVPVIWATQVLENLNKTGFPTRSEVTDAAHASMAECVMINKGPHIIEAMTTLKAILNKNGRHHWKKRNMMRPLNIANQFFIKN